MKPFLRKTGKLGEDLAVRFLRSRGYKILGINLRTPFGEIDIVAKAGRETVFVEVKSRVSAKAGAPLESITRLKQRHIIRNCQYYLLKYGLEESPCRIDAISVKLDGEGRLMELKHVKNAFGLEALNSMTD